MSEYTWIDDVRHEIVSSEVVWRPNAKGVWFPYSVAHVVRSIEEMVKSQDNSIREIRGVLHSA